MAQDRLEEQLQGRGRLTFLSPGRTDGRPSVQSADQDFEVEYWVKFSTSLRTSRPRLRRIEVRSASSVEIRTMDGRAIPEGIYELTAEDSETLRVTNAGGRWHVLSEV
jgi:hypothetical protein